MLHSAFQKLGEMRGGLNVGLLCYTYSLQIDTGKGESIGYLLFYWVRFLGNTDEF